MHLATLTRHPAPIGGYRPEGRRPTGAHGLEQMALSFTPVALLSSYCLCVCGGLSFSGTGRGVGGRKFQSPLALKLGPYSLHRRSLTPKALLTARPHAENKDKSSSVPRALLPQGLCSSLRLVHSHPRWQSATRKSSGLFRHHLSTEASLSPDTASLSLHFRSLFHRPPLRSINLPAS